MKTFGNLFDRFCSFENLLAAYEKARRGKRTRADVLRFDYDLESELSDLHHGLAADTWRPGA